MLSMWMHRGDIRLQKNMPNPIYLQSGWWIEDSTGCVHDSRVPTIWSISNNFYKRNFLNVSLLAYMASFFFLVEKKIFHWKVVAL